MNTAAHLIKQMLLYLSQSALVTVLCYILTITVAKDRVCKLRNPNVTSTVCKHMDGTTAALKVSQTFWHKNLSVTLTAFKLMDGIIAALKASQISWQRSPNVTSIVSKPMDGTTVVPKVSQTSWLTLSAILTAYKLMDGTTAAQKVSQTVKIYYKIATMLVHRFTA